MFCPSCGKSIPDEGNFCLHCGAPVADHDKDLSLRETSAVALEIQGFWLRGPTEIKKGFMERKVGRGFEWAISLLDSENQQTTSDGKLIVVFRWDTGTSDVVKGKVYKATIKEAYRVAASSEVVWHNEFDVRKEDFKWVTYTSGWSGAESRRLVYDYLQTSPLLYFKPEIPLALHCWFITPDERCIYKPRGDTLWWRE